MQRNGVPQPKISRVRGLRRGPPSLSFGEQNGAREFARPFWHGASRARTGDLQRATLALSQLSYGPEPAQCSVELVLLSPVDAELLVVPRWFEAQVYDGPAAKEFGPVTDSNDQVRRNRPQRHRFRRSSTAVSGGHLGSGDMSSLERARSRPRGMPTCTGLEEIWFRDRRPGRNARHPGVWTHRYPTRLPRAR
jgi:hypothetical protein